MSAEEITAANDVMLERQEAEFATLKRLESLVTAAEEVFPGAASAKELDPAATADAENSENEAAENAQVRPSLPMQSLSALLPRSWTPPPPPTQRTPRTRPPRMHRCASICPCRPCRNCCHAQGMDMWLQDPCRAKKPSQL